MQDIESMYKDYFKTVYKYLLCLSRDKDIAEELTQETFCIAIDKINSFRGDCKLSVWLCQIAKNLWFAELKKNKKLTNNIDLYNFSSLDITENIIDNEDKLLLYKKMQCLDEKTREVIYLRISGELSFKEIATILNKTENWTRVTFYRGKQKLKEEILNEGL